MKKINTTIFMLLFISSVFFAQRTFVMQKNYNPSGSWTNQTLYDDGTHGDELAGDGIYSFADVITDEYSGNVQRDWIVVETTDGGWTSVTPYVWFIHYQANQSILFTFDINKYSSDDWAPDSLITNTDDQPNSKTFMPFFLDGARDGDMYDDGDLAGKGDEVSGDGIWARKIVVPTAGSHTWYTYCYDVNYTGEHRWSENGRVKSTSDDIEFTTTKNNQTVYFYLDFNKGRILTKLDTPTPVELTKFTANNVDGNIILNWETATEVNNYGFNIESSLDKTNWHTIGFVEGHGNSNTPNNYSYVATNGGRYYRLQQQDLDGSVEYSNIVEVETNLSYKLQQNHPNPFNPSTIITFTLPENTQANVSIYNALGQKVQEIVNSYFIAGNHSVTVNASALSSGLYFYKLETPNFSKTMKMLLLK